MGDEYAVKSCSDNHGHWLSLKIFCFVGRNMDGITLVNVKCRVSGSVSLSEKWHLEKQQL